MNELLQYEEQLAQQWADLPLPDENMAWADMKRRLDEKDDDRLIPVWLRGCALWGVIGILLMGFIWWLLSHENRAEIKDNSSKGQVHLDSVEPKGIDSSHMPSRDKMNSNDKYSLRDADDSTSKNFYTVMVREQRKKKQISTGKLTDISSGKRRPTISEQNLKKSVENKSVITNKPAEEKETTVITLQKNSEGNQKEITGIDKRPEENTTSAIKPDTTTKNAADSLQKDKQSTIIKSSQAIKDSTVKKKISFSVGIAMHQQLPISGQKFTPYNAEGRKGSIADYIPSVYFRIIKEHRWFIQSEFRYGAPQNNRNILYSQTITLDSPAAVHTTTNSIYLRKTFYHQLPVSFNYFITKKWSLGGGIVWNKFVSAVSSQDIIKHNNFSGTDSFITKNRIFSTKQLDSNGLRQSDSNFVKSYFQGIFETQYGWNKFLIGIRYTFGLQPYIKFTLPGAGQQEGKNNSLNIFLRYELWRSKK